MLQIRRTQMRVLEDAGWRQFEDEMLLHSQRFAPKLSTQLGDGQLRIALRQAIAHAREYGFSNRGPVRLYIESTFLFGSSFDSDPQYPWARRTLIEDDDQMSRAEKLVARILDYQRDVSGPGAVNTRNALRALNVIAHSPLDVSEDDFVPRMLDEVRRAFPQKAAYVGEIGLTTLIAGAQSDLEKYHFPVRGLVTAVILMFAFGHGCMRDPLYPWIASTLQDQRIVNSSARAARLEKKALTWLDHVIARFNE
jgi:hypothetical protein